MEENTPRPNLNFDKNYLDSVESLIQGKGNLEKIHFEYLSETLLLLGIKNNPYSEENNKDSSHIQAIADKAFEALNSQEHSEEVLAKIYHLWDYLAESDPLEKADLIYVFGGISQPAVQEAIRLKKSKYAPKILFSGKKASYMKDVSITEAEQYQTLAIQEGVEPENILIEIKSINTPENIVNSAKLLHKINYLPKSVIAVSLPYHMRRASLTMKAGFDWEFKLIRHPGKSAKYERETYFKDKNGWAYIFFEYIKMFTARKMGHF